MFRLKSVSHVLAWAAAFLSPVLLSQQNKPASTPQRKAVVVELFTSEGCSSCPPADELLARLRQERRPDGVQVIPLGLHVDYWNFQGWEDRFSSKAYSERQFRYAEQFHLQGPYTPQLVFDGAAESSGGDSQRAHELIAECGQRSAVAEVNVSMAEKDMLQIRVQTVRDLKAEVMLAVTEDNLASKVGAGENNGRELRHAAVVRELRSLGSIKNNSFAATVPLKIKNEWKRNDLRAVVFIQESGHGTIDGASSVALANQIASGR